MWCGQWTKLNNDKGKTITAVWRRRRQKDILSAAGVKKIKQWLRQNNHRCLETATTKRHSFLLQEWRKSKKIKQWQSSENTLRSRLKIAWTWQRRNNHRCLDTATTKDILFCCRSEENQTMTKAKQSPLFGDGNDRKAFLSAAVLK